jgi:hypothetical protein
MTCSIDNTNGKTVVNALDATAVTANGTTVGEIIDTKDFESITFLLTLTARSGGDATPLIEDGDESDLSDAAAVADAFLIGTEAGAKIDAANEVSKIGYVGKKRYVRLSSVNANSANLTVTGLAIEENFRKEV